MAKKSSRAGSRRLQRLTSISQKAIVKASDDLPLIVNHSHTGVVRVNSHSNNVRRTESSSRRTLKIGGFSRSYMHRFNESLTDIAEEIDTPVKANI